MNQNKNTLFYARRAGTVMGIFWISKFILLPLGFEIPFLHLIFMFLTLAVPVVGYQLVKKYRDNILGGVIKFSHAFTYTMGIFLFASLLTTMAHFIYFRFIDKGYIISKIETIINEVLTAVPTGKSNYFTEMNKTIEIVGSLSPIEITLQMMGNNLFYGTIYAIIIALFVKKSPNYNQSI
jgi:hypothetical protein